MIDIFDIMYGIRDQAVSAVEVLRANIKEAQALLDRYDELANDMEESAELLAASDLYPTSFAAIPKRSGLVRNEKDSDVSETGQD